MILDVSILAWSCYAVSTLKPVILSYGGGTQSTAIACLIAKGDLPRPTMAVIADTSREASETWDYLFRHAKPLLEGVGVRVQVAHHDYATVDLYAHNGDLLLPAYTANGMLPGLCSNEWKKRVIQRFLRKIGYGTDNPITTWLGISVDEVGRAKPSGVDWQEYAWPLLDLRLNRADCVRVVKEFGLPPPPRSACWMCPYRANREWRHLRDNYPEDFQKAITLDAEIRAKDTKGGLYLHKDRVPLDQADLEPNKNQMGLFGEVEHCDSGMCWV